MAIIEYSRTIRPSTRLKTSVNYRVNVSRVLNNDTLFVTIMHESLPLNMRYRIDGHELRGKQNISFRVEDRDGQTDIIWNGVVPQRIG